MEGFFPKAKLSACRPGESTREEQNQMVGWLARGLLLDQRHKEAHGGAPTPPFHLEGLWVPSKKPVPALAKQVWASGRECDESAK